MVENKNNSLLHSDSSYFQISNSDANTLIKILEDNNISFNTFYSAGRLYLESQAEFTISGECNPTPEKIQLAIETRSMVLFCHLFFSVIYYSHEADCRYTASPCKGS